MKTIYAALGMMAAIFIVPQGTVQAHPGVELRHVADDYAIAADLFHRSLCRCRRGSDYTERLADKLACAARDLSDAARYLDDPRRVAVAYDEVYALHTRLSELLGPGCSHPDPVVAAYWQPMDIEFERLVCALEGCVTVCPHVVHWPPHHRQPVVASPSRHRQSGVGIGIHISARPPVVVHRPELHPHLPTPDWRNHGPRGVDHRDNGRRDIDHRDNGRGQIQGGSLGRNPRQQDVRSQAIQGLLSRILK